MSLNDTPALAGGKEVEILIIASLTALKWSSKNMPETSIRRNSDSPGQ